MRFLCRFRENCRFSTSWRPVHHERCVTFRPDIGLYHVQAFFSSLECARPVADSWKNEKIRQNKEIIGNLGIRRCPGSADRTGRHTDGRADGQPDLGMTEHRLIRVILIKYPDNFVAGHKMYPWVFSLILKLLKVDDSRYLFPDESRLWEKRPVHFFLYQGP